ncbi:MAG: ABC transporter substrate-binding protein [Sphingomicrobium sp.]
MRRLLTLLLGMLAVASSSACRREPEGTLKVVVIGKQPQLRDPAIAALSAPDQLLLANVAQGLVRLDANGNIVPGLAERWNVSDDGLSYIFRIASAKWADGRSITAPQVAKVIKRYLAGRTQDRLRDSLGAVDDVVAMTDRVIEIRLIAPRPNLLPLLAQPQLAIVRNGTGTGPFRLSAGAKDQGGGWQLTRDITAPDDQVARRDQVLLSGGSAAEAISGFAQGRTDLVLGGTFADLSLVQRVKLPRGSLRFDPPSGLFGLIPADKKAGAADIAMRKLLSQGIDRDALIAVLAVPNLAPRTTLLEPGLDGISPFAAPGWTATPLQQRLPTLRAQAARMIGTRPDPTIGVALPEGPGADLLLRQLQHDWGALGFRVERTPASPIATFMLIDEVAPSASPAWFVRRFQCSFATQCDPAADKLLEAARTQADPPQRYALVMEAAALIDDAQLFIPLTAPVRWSLASGRIQSFAGNRYARHTLTDLDQRPGSGD